jgi:uncharacterized protein YqjF (DUF2071 family)
MPLAIASDDHDPDPEQRTAMTPTRRFSPGARAPIDLLEAVTHRLPGQEDAVRQAAALRFVGHRPWPLPETPWVMGQTWRELLFAHWPLAPERLRTALPNGVEPDVFDGTSWIGVTPFEVTGGRLRGTAALPRLSRFLEVNVRTYVTIGGRPGVWFLSLDAASRLAVAGARRTYRLPYFHATMQLEHDDGAVLYKSRRRSRDGDPVELAMLYQPAGAPFTARPGSLAHFLTERYCLYTVDEHRRLRRAEIHHPPWPLQNATASVRRLTMTEPHGITLADPPALLHFARRQDVVIWPLEAARDEPA